MKIRRIAATAVAAAVTAPALFLSAAPAFADTKPTAGVSQAADSPIEELKLAVAAAQAKYDAAFAANEKAQAEVRALLDDKNHRLVLANNEASRASKEAAAAKSAADTKLAAAETALATAEEALAKATEEEKAKAQADVDAAKAAVATATAEADTAKATAAAKAAEAAAASDALDDMYVEAFKTLNAPKKNLEEAKKALDEAKKALQDAEAETPDDEACQIDKNIGMSLTGPQKITVGTSGVFTFRVTNKGKVPYGDVGGSAVSVDMKGPLSDDLKVSWSSANSPKWKPINDPEKDFFSSNSALAPGKSFDFKLKIDAAVKTPVGDGGVAAFALSISEDSTKCGEAEQAVYASFRVVKPAKPGSGNDNGTNGNGTTGGSKGNGNASPQGGTSKTPLTSTSTTSTSTTSGRLASTGAGPSTLPFALAGGAAVVLGAGAMVMVRRRKAGEGA
ncbi:peptidase [Streptomyces laurentii]|uniref:peptidase n=1 Tax=Streptomyces laurentii TaxID=39478 RepID=UPI00367BCC6E